MDKNVLYISNSMIPSKAANTVHVMKMCNALSEHSCSVTLLAKTKNRINQHGTVREHYSVGDGFKIKLSYIYAVPGFSVLISVVYFFLYAIYRKAMDRSIVIYSRNRHTSFMLSIFGIKTTYELHGIAKSKLQNKLDKFICQRKHNRLVVISDVLRNDLAKQFNIEKKSILVAHDAADLVDTSNIMLSNLNGNFKVNVGYVGSLLEGKGVDVLCNSASNLPEFGFHIVGGNENDVEIYKKKFSYLDNVYFYGYVNHKKVQSYINMFDVVVLPNKANVITSNGENIGKYTSPLKLFEYMSFGKNIVLSDLPVLHEVISTDEGEYFEPGCHNSLSKAIVKAANNKESGYKARDKFISKFTWSSRAKAVLR